MRIVHIVESFGGGVYSYFKDLSSFLSQFDEIETTIIYSNKRKEVTDEQIKNDFPENIKMLSVNMERELRPIADIRATLKLRKILKQISPDIVHLHSSKAGVIGRWASTLSGKRKGVYYTPHGYSFLQLNTSSFKRRLFYLIEKTTQLIFGGTTIACGDTEYNIAKKIGKSELVRNGIDIDNINKFFIPKNPSKDKKLTIGIIGRIVFARNPTLFNKIALQFPEHDFIWIGDGDLKYELTAKNIFITGWCKENIDVFRFLNKIDIYIQTSLWEGLPIAILEAMAFRKPIIATNVIGNKDIVIPEYNGFLFEKAEDLKSILNQLENSKTREIIGNNAFNNCREKYNKDENFKKLIDIYKSTLIR
ncbi:glycosyltransferase [Myroides phaeus]|uniref:glycosyltransferase n=1 Tax=Myroides phaeus TaxID=702745 RepID=UPI002DBE1CEB|nr:glycosyltransferase [Myroides phaeus]